MDDPRAHHLVDGLDDSELPAASTRLHASQAAAPRRKLSREESLALVRQVWGEPSEEGRAWALRALGLGDDQRKAS